MKYKKVIVSLVVACCGILYSSAENNINGKLQKVKSIVNNAIEWQFEHMPEKGRGFENPRWNGWADGVFLSAVADWDEYDPTAGFRKIYQKIAEDIAWEPGRRSINPANDLAVCLAYAKIYQLDPKPRHILTDMRGVQWNPDTWDKLLGGWKMLIPTIERLDFQMKDYPKTKDYNPHLAINQERWSWCDALYMAAPTYALFAELTDDHRYRKFMNREFWSLMNLLYDKEEHLVFRDINYLDKKEPNGKKVFWGRGNGWVVGALVRVMNYLPDNYKPKRKYEKVFCELMERIASLQDSDGYWHTSLLDPQSYPMPETSASGFFTYGLWWGINEGLLNKEHYLPIAQRAWEAMVRAIQPSGMLGYVQPIGDRPENISAEKNEVYGTAALALAGLEVCRYLEQNNANRNVR